MQLNAEQTVNRLMAISIRSEESGYAQLCKTGETEGYTVIAFRYTAHLEELGIYVLFFEVEPGCNANEPAFEAVVAVEDKLFFGDGKTPLNVVWRNEACN